MSLAIVWTTRFKKDYKLQSNEDSLLSKEN